MTTAKKYTKKREARAKLLFCYYKPNALLPLSLPSPSSLPKLNQESEIKIAGYWLTSFLPFYGLRRGLVQ